MKRKQSPGRKCKDQNPPGNNKDKKDTFISKLHAAIAKANEDKLALESATRDNLKKG